MNDVKFPVNGTIKFKKAESSETLPAGTGIIIDPYDFSIVAKCSGVDSFSIPDAHTSKDTYLVAPADYGRVGTISEYGGLSPTDQVHVNTFQWVPNHLEGSGLEVISSGTDFEDLTMGNLQVQSIYGSGSVTYSGIRSVAVLDGSAYFASRAASFRTFWLEPTSSGAENLTCGRTVYLAKLPDNTNTNRNGEVGFAFMRQGADPDSFAYKVYTENRSSSTTDRTIAFTKNSISSATGDQLSGRGFSVFASNFGYSSNAERVDASALWMMVEWEVQPSGTIVQVAHQPYNDGDTIESISGTWRPLWQCYDIKNSIESTSLKPTWILASRANNAEGDVGIDNVWLYKLDSLPKQGLNSYRIAHYNHQGGSGDPLISNYFAGGGSGTPEGWGNSGQRHPLITADQSPTGVAGEASGSGLRASRLGGATTDRPSAMFEHIEPTASGITHGVARMIYETGTTSFSSTPRQLFCFMRQGDRWNSNAYYIEFYPNSSSDWRVRLRKGKIFSDTYDSGADVQGAVLATSATLHTSASTNAWIEVRWEVVSPSETRIEILHAEVDTSFTTFDASPGNVDYELSQVISYSDITGAYISTSLAPMHVFRCVNTNSWMKSVELRRAKG